MSIIVANTTNMEREEWLNHRKKGIGGSDIGSIAGFNKWKSPIVVYMEKIDEAPEADISNMEAAYWGNVMEDTVAQEFTKRSGLKVRKRNALLQHQEHDFILANVDRMIVGKNQGLECKTASEYLKKEWEGDEIPMTYLLQCQHYMAVTGAEGWWIAVLIGGNKFFYKYIERDEYIIDQIIEICKDFWNNHVLAHHPPEIDGSDASTDFLKALYPDAEENSEIELPEDADTLLEEYELFKQQEKEAKTAKQEAENKLKQYLGSNEQGYSTKRIISWKPVTTNRFDSKTFQKEHPELFEKYQNQTVSRRFGVKEAK